MASRQRRRQGSPPIRPRHAYAKVAAGAAALGLLAAFADRPIARWFSATFHGTSLEHAAVMGFRLLDWLLPFVGVLLVALLVAFRLRPDVAWLRRAVSAGLAVAVALIATEALKFAIGRSQVWPQFLQDGVYMLRPFQFDRGFTSFPSGTMAGSTAFVTGLRLRRSLERPLAAVVIAFFTLVLFITSGHWASDILGGTILGLFVGRKIARRFYPGT